MRFIVAAVWVVLSASAALALSPEEQRGLTFAEANCALCHAVTVYDQSALPLAPPFRTLPQYYDDYDALAEALAEGMVSGHPSMPRFQLDAAQISDLIAYLRALAPADQ